MIGSGHEELEESYTGDITLPPADRPAGRAERRAGCRWPARLRDISLEVRAGEVLGIYGFMGCGQIELARILFGKLKPDRGHARQSTASHKRLPQHRRGAPRRHRLRAGEPARHAVPPGAGLQEHLDQHARSHLAAAAEAGAASAHIARRQVEQLQIRPADGRARCCGMLSGGNQQKVALAKWLTYPPSVLVLSEPTRGMDVGAKDDVVKIVRGPARPRGSPSSCCRPSPRRCCRWPTASW